MNKEKVRELVNSILTATVLHKQSVEIEHIITEWLEQNQPSPIEDAPVDAVEYEVSGHFLSHDETILSGVVISRIERPKPTQPVVEVGQVWLDKHTDSKADVLCVGEMTAGDESLLGVLFKINGRKQMVSSDYFIDRFERVS